MGDFNTSLSIIDMSSRLKNGKDLPNTITMLDLLNTCRILLQGAFFANTNGTFTKIDHIVGFRQVLTTFKELVIFRPHFSFHSAIKLDMNSKIKSKYIPTHLEIKPHV